VIESIQTRQSARHLGQTLSCSTPPALGKDRPSSHFRIRPLNNAVRGWSRCDDTRYAIAASKVTIARVERASRRTDSGAGDPRQRPLQPAPRRAPRQPRRSRRPMIAEAMLAAWPEGRRYIGLLPEQVRFCCTALTGLRVVPEMSRPQHGRPCAWAETTRLSPHARLLSPGRWIDQDQSLQRPCRGRGKALENVRAFGGRDARTVVLVGSPTTCACPSSKPRSMSRSTARAARLVARQSEQLIGHSRHVVHAGVEPAPRP